MKVVEESLHDLEAQIKRQKGNSFWIVFLPADEASKWRRKAKGPKIIPI